jgi:uncharacterized membrane protein affecting hemolysin expression
LNVLDFFAYGAALAIILFVIGVVIALVQGAATEAERRQLREDANLEAVNRIRAKQGLCPLEKEDIL